MPDFTMCTGEGCELRISCYRHIAEPSSYQPYMHPPIKDGTCAYYMKLEPSDKTRVILRKKESPKNGKAD